MMQAKEGVCMSAIPPIDPRIVETSRQMMRQQRKQARRQWLIDHVFDLFNSILALIALIVAIFGLFLPQG